MSKAASSWPTSLTPALPASDGFSPKSHQFSLGDQSAQESVATTKSKFNPAQIFIRQRIITSCREYKSLFYTPSRTQKLFGSLESKVDTLQQDILQDMSLLDKPGYDYGTELYSMINPQVFHDSELIPRQLIEFLSEYDDVPTYREAVEESRRGQAFVELNWILKEVPRLREDDLKSTRQHAGAAE